MMNRFQSPKLLIWILLLGFESSPTPVVAQPVSSDNYVICPRDFSAGGDRSDATVYRLDSSLGQSAGIGMMGGSLYQAERGLWPVAVQKGFVIKPTPTPTNTPTPLPTSTPTPTPTPFAIGIEIETLAGEGGTIPLGSEVFSSVTIAELDGDSEPELVFGTDRTGSNDASMGVYAINLDGSPAGGLWPLILNVDVRASAAAADLDNDGLDEVVVGTYGPPDTLLILDSDGSRIGAAQSTNSIISSPAIADLDGDGDLEIVVGTSDERLLAVESNGAPAPGSWPVMLPPPSRRLLGGNDADSSPAIGDLDGDGLPEVAILSDEGVLYVYHGDGAPVPGFPFEAPRDSFASTLFPSVNFASPLITDLDGDGRLDILVAMSNARIYALDAQGNHLDGFPLRLPPTLPPDTPARSGDDILSSPVVDDLDGDNLLELAVAFYDGQLRQSMLYVYDLAVSPPHRRTWPTFQTNGLRTGLYVGEPDPDIDGNGILEASDIAGLILNWYRTGFMPGFNPKLDLDFSSRIDAHDLLTILDLIQSQLEGDLGIRKNKSTEEMGPENEGGN